VSIMRSRSSSKRRASRPHRPPLSIEEILAWADAYFAENKRWPNVNSGYIRGTIDDTWSRMDNALRAGNRQLPKNSGLTFARLLEQRRGVRNSEYPPKLSVSKVVQWARAHRRRTGRWPKANDGAIVGVRGETWMAVDMALRKGKRGLMHGSSLARLLASQCGVRNHQQAPRLRINQILAWADAHYRRHGRWPVGKSGPVEGVPGETWIAVDKALRAARRGLSEQSSLSRLLANRRGVVRRRNDSLVPASAAAERTRASRESTIAQKGKTAPTR
jgi:hypothetical protein